MNITMNSASLPVSGDAAAAVTGATPGEALPLDPALAAAQPGAQAPLAFLQFMQMDAALPAEALPQPELAGSAAEALEAGMPAAAGAQEDQAEAAPEEGQPLLAAMNMPLMPSMMTLPAALPAVMRLAAGMPERQERSSAAAGLPRTGEATAPAAPQPAALPVQAADGAALQLRATAQAGQPAQPAATQPAIQAASGQAAQGVASDVQAAAESGDAANGGGANTGFGIAAQSSAASPARDGGTVTLSGPPTAWRQSLQEALGERLNLQLGKNAEQAVIRLEPPMLGRIEISIRHAAGSLEVNITATHGEVLRQLNSVSDNLRSDLAQRQYTDVSVNVSQATPRAQAAQAGAQFGADAQGRGRQQGQDERAPGAALAEANQSTSPFSLNGRA